VEAHRDLEEPIVVESQPRPLDSGLLIVAVLGPIFHVAGFVARGVGFFYSDVTRLAVAYVALALSGAAAAWLVARRQNWSLRLVAAAALIANLGSVAYAGGVWSRDMRRALADAVMAPIEAGKIGIALAPADDSAVSAGELAATEEALLDILRRNGLQGSVVVRRIQAVSSQEQAEHVGSRLNANVVVWKTVTGLNPVVEHRYVTVLGANEDVVDLEPVSLMLLMATQRHLTVRTEADPVESGVSPFATDVIAPVAAGYGALAAQRPVVAALQFQGALSVEGLPAQARRDLHNQLGTALLLADRADLAIQAFESAQEIEPSADGWMGLGAIALAARDWDRASLAFARAIALDPYAPAPYCGLGVLFGRDHQVSRAVASYRQAVALDPEGSVPYAFLGMGLELQADVEGAQRAFATAASLAGSNTGLHLAALERADAIGRNPPTAVPTATALPTPTVTPIPTEGVYVVQGGDTLKAIAEQFNITIEEIIEINQLENPNALSVGQILIIPEEP
jgi:Flp pilus assembly protein TadD